MLLLLLLCCTIAVSSTFISPPPRGGHWRKTTTAVPDDRCFSAKSSATSVDSDDAVASSSSSSLLPRIEECKISLLRMCNDIANKKKSVLSINEIESLVCELERLHSQTTSMTKNSNPLINGVWELVYTPTDTTRSSPFFWAFRRAFPDTSDRIFDITDSIPARLKEIGPATQTIDTEGKTLVSRVEVATLGGAATSIMTTRCDILGSGSDGTNHDLRIRVSSTKPEEATIVTKVLGPLLGGYINSSSPPFPSGDVLETVAPGSSEVVIRTTYCDEGLRITRNADRPKEDVFVWKRVKFGIGQTISL